MVRKSSARQAGLMKDRAAQRLQELLESAEDLLKSLRDEEGEAVEELRAKVSSTIRSASSQLEDLAQTATGFGRNAARYSARFVRSDPWRTAAIAAITLLGFTLLMRRGDD